MALMITGATGGLGQLLLPHLSNLFSTTTIHALSRKPPSPSPYPNVVYHRGDFGDKDSLLAAFSGIKTLLLISTNEFDPSKRTPDQFRAVDAAKEAGVEWILYTSLALIEGMTVMESHVETEKYIKQCVYVYPEGSGL